MSRARLRLALGLAGVLALVLTGVVAKSGASVTPRGTIAYTSFRSTALEGTMHYSVYLPRGYATSGRRYPVVYYLHGLPGTATDYRSIEQLAAAVEASGHPAIVIGVQGARAGDSDPEW